MHLTIDSQPRFAKKASNQPWKYLMSLNTAENIIFAVHLTHYIMYLPFTESNIKITTYIYRGTDKFPA